MSKPLIITSIAAVVVSSFALAASGWVIANERGRASEPRLAHAPDPWVGSKSTTKEEPNVGTMLAKVEAPKEEAEVPTVDSKATLQEPGPTKKAHRDFTATAPASELKVRRLVVSTGVKDREPVGTAEEFSLGDARVYAFVELANGSSHDADILIVFERGSTRTGLVELGVPARSGRWRTWGYSRGLQESGTWNVVVREKHSGQELARKLFEVTEKGTEPDTENNNQDPTPDPYQPMADGTI